MNISLDKNLGEVKEPAAEAFASRGSGLLADGFEEALARALGRSLGAHFTHAVVQPLVADIVEFCARDGKRVRPLLYLEGRRIFSEASGAEALSRRDLSVAVGLELLHAFILIHDDLIDRSAVRRGKPSMHKLVEKRLSALSDREKSGRDIALVIGDILFALAQKSVLGSGLSCAGAAAVKLLEYMVDTGVGEIGDIVFGIQDVSKVEMEDIEWMYWLKTSRYSIECPLVMAATISGLDGAMRSEIARVVAPAGLAFQIVNDLKDFQNFEVSDSYVPDDIVEGKKTAVVRMAFDMLDETDKSFLQLCMSGMRPNEATVNKVRELIVKSGALVAMRRKAELLFEETATRLGDSTLPGAMSDELCRLVHALRDKTQAQT